MGIKKESPRLTTDLRIAGILDELSQSFFPYECKFLNLDANIWKDQIEEFKPDLVFIESAWNGFNKTWKDKLAPAPKEEFINLIQWVKNNKIPTVFWNKEDPVHFGRYLNAASYFDYVLTTDLDCVPLYKRLLGHDQVYCMPFASCVQMYSPIEKYERYEGACFAGSYYNRREERKKDFEGIVNLITERWDLEIYDRNPHPNNPDYTYPKQYQKYIVGSLPPDKVDIAYKSYNIGITLNIVKNSSTMEARRAFELLSCNTLVLSNECLGLRNLFGDLIVYYDNPENCRKRLFELFENQLLRDKIKLLALRKVLQEHTYKERVEFLYELVFKSKSKENLPRIAVYSVVNDIKAATNVINSFQKQKYSKKKLFLFSKNRELLAQKLGENGNFQVLDIEEMTANLEFLDNCDFYAYFGFNNYYGSNYLVDLVLNTKYEVTSTVIGKGSYYTYKNDSFQLIESIKRYSIITELKADRAIVSANYKKSIGFFGNKESDYVINGVSCLSIDPFNFCENYTLENCDIVDDFNHINQGISIHELNQISTALEPEQKYYDTSLVLSKDRLFNLVRTIPGKIEKVSILDGDVGIYTVGKFTKTYNLDLRKKFIAEEFVNSEDVMNIYVNVLINGAVRIICTFYDSMDKNLGSFQVFNRGCTAIRKRENATYFKLYFEIKGESQIILREIIFNPTPKNAILTQYLSEQGVE